MFISFVGREKRNDGVGFAPGAIRVVYLKFGENGVLYSILCDKGILEKEGWSSISAKRNGGTWMLLIV